MPCGIKYKINHTGFTFGSSSNITGHQKDTIHSCISTYQLNVKLEMFLSINLHGLKPAQSFSQEG